MLAEKKKSPFDDKRVDAALDLFERVNRARIKLKKRPGEVTGFKANCPVCKKEQGVSIVTDGKRMLRVYCETPDCVRAIG